ncbi:MAG: acetyltransferase [Clostridium sp. 44_14]|uniref:helix-turn-helix domain-containing protein n=1 Tax=Jutongia sp. TaxID=2944204 RepID=UPI00095C45DD|nr:helix-turn-helix domain-containing protein [Clostridium sp.]OKZ83183.1 MAG: acetyltransferase [Clostridium sp. 44_14]
MDIKEMRDMTRLTQREFAAKFDIPIGTLRRWEYGESKPAPYIIKLIALQLPVDQGKMEQIKDEEGNIFFYNKEAGYLMDMQGTRINIKDELEEVKKQNLILYIKDLFEAYYEILDKFDRNCKLDKTEDIIWS